MTVNKSLKKEVEKILASETPDEYIKASGIDLLAIYTELGDIALHAEVMAKDRDGDVFSMGRDSRSRLIAIGMILELKKHLKDKGSAVQVAVFNDPRLEDDAKAVVARMNK